MTYIENIFICMVSPLLVAALCMGRLFPVLHCRNGDILSLRAAFWRLSNFFEKFFVLGESFFDFLYLYK